MSEGAEHSIEGLRIRCGQFFGVVKNGVCMECGQRVKVVVVEG